jgi:hypothetical protein
MFLVVTVRIGQAWLAESMLAGSGQSRWGGDSRWSCWRVVVGVCGCRAPRCEGVEALEGAEDCGGPGGQSAGRCSVIWRRGG